ncbi:hypothetical protein VMCG_06063 [Cytospora schulzeri]|uniref:O-methyltransferase C-terminal domain-containing protein n=1 Tax=Cytospora schulzeri TaxID=448051 RepID=A0A423WGJ5_9PEZI|nr:hypothetical protein VMCG_06063 [Valsa malicola]
MASNTSTTRILQLAETISTSVARIQEVLTSKDLPSPSFKEDALSSLPREATDAQNAVLDATAELRDLLIMDPMLLIHGHGGHNNSLCQQAIAHFGIAAMVPPGGRVSFADIARQTPLTEQDVGRLLRHAMNMRIFYEPEPGMVAHTKASRILADSVTNNWLRVGTEEMWAASTKVVDALKKYPGSQEPNETGFCIANNTAVSIYSVLGSNPERAMRFEHAMVAYAGKPEQSPAYITDHFDWASLGQARSNMSEANVIFFRWSLRNWADKYCVMALKAQVPVLKPGARIIIQDTIMPEPGAVPLWKEKNARSADLSLMATFNARERTAADWKTLVEGADPGFVLKSVVEPEGSALGILEFVWEGKA